MREHPPVMGVVLVLTPLVVVCFWLPLAVTIGWLLGWW